MADRHRAVQLPGLYAADGLVQTPGFLAVFMNSQVLVPEKGEEQDGQLLLSDEAGWPIRQDLVELVKEKRFAHTGKIVAKDEELCREVCMDLIRGLSTRLVAKKYRISRNTVGAIHAVMEKRGELEPLKKQVSALLGKAIVFGLENFIEALATNQISPGQLPIPIAALIDKKELIDGNATARIEGSNVQEISVEQVQDFWERMKKADAQPTEPSAIDAESTVSAPQPQQIEGNPLPATTAATFQDDNTTGNGPTGPATASRSDGAQTGGEGVANGEGDGNAKGFAPEKILPEGHS